MLDKPTDAMIERAAAWFADNYSDDREWEDMLRQALDATLTPDPVQSDGEDARRQGQAEGFAAAVTQLRDMSAQNPPATLWHAASMLADQLEQSRIPARLTSLSAPVEKD